MAGELLFGPRFLRVPRPATIMLKRAGDVVTREELRAQICTIDTFVDFDHSLHNAIARLHERLRREAPLH